MRKAIVTGLIIACAAGSPAWARTLTEEIVQQLREQGYNRIDVSRTLLGRDRITATSATRDREIIVNPRTGEILRDYWQDRDPDEDADTIIESDDSTGTSGRGGSVNSGSGNSGSGNSGKGGSGSGGSGSGSDDHDDGGDDGHDDGGGDDHSGSGGGGDHGDGGDDHDDGDD